MDTTSHDDAARGTRRTLGAAGLALALLAGGCSSSGESVPQITVGGTPDSQRSIAASQVVAARKAAGIKDCPTSNQSATATDGGLPALAVKCLGGDTTVNLAGLPTGTPRVINVWAQWCNPCMQEARYMAEVNTQAKGKVAFLGVDYDDPQVGKVIDFATAHGMTYPEVAGTAAQLRGPLQVAALPTTIFVDARGTVVHRQSIAYTSADMLRTDVKKYLGVSL